MTAPVVIAPGPPSLSLGVGDVTYAPLTDGQMAQIIHGPQGGYHIVVALLATGIWPGTPGVPGSPDNPTTTFTALRASGAEIELTDGNINVLRAAFAPVDGGVVLVNRYLRLATTDPRSLGGEKLLLRARVVDRDGRTVTDDKRVIAIAPSN